MGMAQQKSLMKKTATATVALAFIFTLQAVARHARQSPSIQNGTTLVPIVARTLTAGGVTARRVSCEDFKPAKNVKVNCSATINGKRTALVATFVDERTVIVGPKPAG